MRLKLQHFIITKQANLQSFSDSVTFWFDELPQITIYRHLDHPKYSDLVTQF